MLAQLEVRDFAIVEHLTVEFAPGLNVLTGETGAGKSILIDAIEFLVGGRANQTLIRRGAAKTQVQAAFRVEPLAAALDVLGFPPDGGELLLSREFHTTGRSVSRINGTLVPLAAVKEVGELLLDLHGQHEHQSLLKPVTHLDWLDSSDDALWRAREAVAALVGRERMLRRELAALSGGDLDRELDDLRFQLRELDEAKLAPGEEERLREEQERLRHLDELCRQAARVMALLDGDEAPGVLGRLFEGGRLLGEMGRFEPVARGWQGRVEEIRIELEELRRIVGGVAGGTEPDPARLEEVLARLDLIERLKRKYGGDIPAVIAERERIAGRIEELAGREERVAALADELERVKTELEPACRDLSAARRLRGEALAELVNREVRSIALPLEFRVTMASTDRITERGNDSVEFRIRPAGSHDDGWLPLHQVASGGELSRLMLALKVVMATGGNHATRRSVPILVYDEIDAGLGGEAAFAVADRLSALGRSHQVLCVTHLHQIAAAASRHLQVLKESMNGAIHTVVLPLDGDARAREIARMLGGDEPTSTALQHARELLDDRSPELRRPPARTSSTGGPRNR